MREFIKKYKELLIMLVIIIIIVMVLILKLNKTDKIESSVDGEKFADTENIIDLNLSETDANNINQNNIISNTQNIVTVQNETQNNTQNTVTTQNKTQNATAAQNKTQNTNTTQSQTQNTAQSLFLTDFANYNETSTEVLISESKAKQIAQKGFEEAERIAEVGTVESEDMTICNQCANNFFTRKTYEGDKVYTNINRKVYAFQRENEMGNGVTVYVDVTTGLIIGGRAFGD